MGQIQNERAVWSPTSEHMYMLRRIERADAANQSTLRAFAAWLGETRGLQAGSITVRIGSAGPFVDAVTARTGKTCAQAFQSLTAEGVEDFFVQYGRITAWLRGAVCARRSALHWGIFGQGRRWKGVGPHLRLDLLSSKSRGASF
jgi:hypothetical protein